MSTWLTDINVNCIVIQNTGKTGDGEEGGGGGGVRNWCPGAGVNIALFPGNLCL